MTEALYDSADAPNGGVRVDNSGSVIPADNKWFTHVVVADVIIEKLRSLKLNYPVAGKEHRRQLLKAKRVLENEPS